MMKLMRRVAASAALALLAGTAQAGTTTYYLQYMTLETGNAPGQTFYFSTPYIAGSASLGISQCITCVTNASLISGGTGLAVLDDMTNTATISNLHWSLRSFGANFQDDSDGTSVIGAATSYLKSYDSCTLYGGTATQYCSGAFATEPRTYAGSWYEGLRGDGTTACNSCKLSTTANANMLTMILRKPLLASDPAVTGSWLQLSYNFAVVPVPAAVWLLGGALGALGWARRRQLAA